MASRIEQIIEEIEEYIDGCRFQPLSTTKIVVNKEELEELLRELRLKTPDENFPKKGCVSEDEDPALQGAVCVCAIGEKAGISQSTVSQYLETMERAGLLTLVRRGKWTYYRRNEETICALADYIENEL